MKARTTEFTDLNDGIYKGKWSGHKVMVEIPDNMPIEIRVDQAVRGFDIPCKVTAMNNEVIVEQIKQ